MKKIGTAFILILLLTSIIATPIAYAKKGQVTVKVTRVNGKRSKAVNTEVVLKIGNESVAVDTTDDKGKVEFTELKANTEYTLVVVGSDGWHYKEKFTTNKHGGAPQQNVLIR